MDSFLQSLEKLKDVDPKDAMSQIFRFFDAISHMDQPTIIAAHQAFKLFCLKSGIGVLDSTRGDTGIVSRAITGRMVALVTEKEGVQRQELIRVFVSSGATYPDFRELWHPS